MTELKPRPPLRVHVALLKAIFSEIENIATENEKDMHTTVCMYWSHKAWGVKATNMKKTFFFTTDPLVFAPLHISKFEDLEHVSVHTSYCLPLPDMMRILDSLPKQEIILSTEQDELLAFSSRGFQRLTSRKMRPKNIEDFLLSSQREFTVYDFLEGKEVPYSPHRQINFDESHLIVETAKKIGLKSYNTGVLFDERI